MREVPLQEPRRFAESGAYRGLEGERALPEDGRRRALQNLHRETLSTGAPRSQEAPNSLGLPQVPRHRATVGSYGGGVSYERGTPVPHGGLRTFHQKSTCTTQVSVRPCLVQIGHVTPRIASVPSQKLGGGEPPTICD